MSILYVDGRAGASGDMMWSALWDLSRGQGLSFDEELDQLQTYVPHEESYHHRSYRRIEKMIHHAPIPARAKLYAKNIYQTIGRVEAQIHGCTLDNLHLHELGRSEAIHNILGIALFYHGLSVGRLCCSPLTVGSGKVRCSHGDMEVPVPAVRSLMKQSSLLFQKGTVSEELLTPSGLAVLMGLDAEPSNMPRGRIIGSGEGKGTKKTGLGHLKVLLIEEN
jgi:uncharacterized protein (DUF111 family)